MQFGPFAPDALETSGAMMLAENVLPLPEGYGPKPSLVSPAGAEPLPGPCRGMVTVVTRTGAFAVYAFTVDALYQMESDYSWTLIEDGFNCTDGDDWSAVHFGDKLLFTNTTDGLFAYDIEAGGAVEAIPDIAPRYIFVASNMVVALDCLDNLGNRNNRLIRTSARGDHTEWKKREADYQPLEDGRELIAGFDLANGAAVILQGDAVRIMQFGNGPAGASFSLVKGSEGRGAVGARSCVSFDGVVYFLATDGFRRFSLAKGLEAIGAGRVDYWFFSRATESLAEVQGGLDPFRKLVLWRFGTQEMVYSWAFDKWAHGAQSATFYSMIATPGYTLTSWEAEFGDLAGSPDIGIGDRFWSGGQPIFAALDADGAYAVFSGPAMAARLRTSTAIAPVSGLLSSATPLTDAANAQLRVGVSDALNADLAWKPGVGIKPSGRCPVRARGKNMAFELTVPAAASWTYAKGIDHFEQAVGGVR